MTESAGDSDRVPSTLPTSQVEAVDSSFRVSPTNRGISPERSLAQLGVTAQAQVRCRRSPFDIPAGESHNPTVMKQGPAVLRMSPLALLLIVSCGLHYSRSDYRYPPTAVPGELRMSMSVSELRVRAGEPFVVTVSMLNAVDTVSVWGPTAPAGFHLIGSAGDTWDWRPYDYLVDCWSAGGPPPLYGVRPHDSVYWQYVLWPQRFFRRRDTSLTTLRAGSYQLVGRVHSYWVLKDGTPERMPFMPSESIPVAIASDSSPAWLERYRGLLDRWFNGGDWDKKRAAGETLMTVMQTQVDADSFLLTLGCQLSDIAEFGGHWTEALTICESILARRPPGILTEDLWGELPRLYQMTQQRQIADSLVRVFVSRYPQNAAALSYDEGRWLWYERAPVPPTWHRHRRLFLGLPAGWSAWREEKPARLHSASK
jgi:hypothetical protein